MRRLDLAGCGATLGYALFAWQAALIGAVLGYLIAQVRHLRRTLEQVVLAAQFDGESGADEAVERDVSGEPTPPADVPEAYPAPSPIAPPRQTAQPSTSPQSNASLAESKSRNNAVGAWLQTWIDAGVAWLKRGNPLARIGIVVLFFGGAFLAKYSADQGLLPLEVRLASLAAGAIGLIALGAWLMARNRVFALTLQGGGIAGFYLTVFAAMRVFDLMPPTLGFVLMAVIAAAAAVLAVVQNALALALLATVGGFATPLLVASGGGNPTLLFGYYTVLNVGILAIAWFRAWRVLNLAGFVFTFTVSGLFRATAYTPEHLLSTDVFVLLFFVLYVAVSIAYALRQTPDLRGYVSGSLVFGLPVAAFGLHASMIEPIEYGLAASALGFGGFYAVLAWALYLKGRDSLRLLAEAFAALAVIFASLAIPLAFDRQTTTAMWAIEGAGLLWLGVRQQRVSARLFGACLQLAGAAGLVVDLDMLGARSVLLPGAFTGIVLLTAAGLFSGDRLHAARANLTRYEGNAATIAAGLLDLREVVDHPAARFGSIGWPVLLLIGYALLYRMAHAPQPWFAALSPWLHAAGYAVLGVLIASEISRQIGSRIAGVWSQLPWGLIAAALIAIAMAAAAMAVFCAHGRLSPVRRRAAGGRRTYLGIGRQSCRRRRRGRRSLSAIVQSIGYKRRCRIAHGRAVLAAANLG